MIEPLTRHISKAPVVVEARHDHQGPGYLTKRKAIVSSFIALACMAILIIIISNRDNRFFADYNSPLELPVKLAGNFGEVRNDHWHLGLDIRTNGKENLPVRSVAEGYISRVTISATGYGNAIYITHDNNRTSLYAHLNSFSEPVADYVASVQAEKEQWAQDIRLPKGRYKIKRGGIIGLSGNTGFSEGPHLHFEWRNTTTGTSINPLLELLKVTDNLAPVIEDVYWYNRDSGSDQYLAQKIYSLSAPKATAQNSLKTHLVSSRLVSLGITAIDKVTSSPFNMGVYQVRVLVNGRPVYTFKMDSLAQADSRRVNSSIDYARWQNSGECILLLSTWKNALSKNKKTGGDGIIDLGDGNEHNISIETKDIVGNTSSYHFKLKYSGNNKSRQRRSPNFFCGRQASVKIKDAVIVLQPRSFDHDVFFSLSHALASDKNGVSPVISLCQPNLPLQDSLELKIKCSRHLSADEKKHAVLLLQNGAGTFVHRGSWNGNWFTTMIGNLGQARIVTDTVPPSIKLIGWKNRQKIGKEDALKMVISDNIGSIANIRAEVDGRWVPLQQKGNVFTFRMENQTRPAKPGPSYYLSGSQHILMIRAIDVAGNITRNVFRFQY
jgi:hypothetical protein